MAPTHNPKGGEELRPGQRIAQFFEVERKIAEGGMASIYRAKDVRSGGVVAIKCLYVHYDDNPIVRARFLDEGRIQMLLQHPNIVRVFQLIEEPVLAFVMEYVDGGTLEEMLKETGPLALHDILEVTIPMMSALGLAHSRGIIHRDLKPSNILVTRTHGIIRPKIMDFGVAKLNRSQNLTATGTTVGTLHYMSPEQIVGSKLIDGRADIYSLGISLYKLCAGEVPFNAATEFALMMAQVEARPTPPSMINPDVDPGLERVILKALSKAPHQRYQTVREMTSALVALRDRQGRETMEMISVPSQLLHYAMMADKVALDRTDEFVDASREVWDEAAAIETLRGISTDTIAQDAPNFALMDTYKDLLPIDTNATTAEREGIEAVRQSWEGQTSTQEVEVGVMEELQRSDVWSSTSGDEGESATLPVKIDLSQLDDDDPETYDESVPTSPISIDDFSKRREEELDSTTQMSRSSIQRPLDAHTTLPQSVETPARVHSPKREPPSLVPREGEVSPPIGFDVDTGLYTKRDELSRSSQDNIATARSARNLVTESLGPRMSASRSEAMPTRTRIAQIVGALFLIFVLIGVVAAMLLVWR